MSGPEEVKQLETHEGTVVLNHEDSIHELLANGIEASSSATPDTSPATLNQHAEAGRKGAQRIHQLMQHGRLYEREHGLTPGRQRLRQLIQEGKLYEQEHGLQTDSTRSRKTRRTRVSQEQVLKALLQSLLRMAKPAYRSRLLSLLQALEGETP